MEVTNSSKMDKYWVDSPNQCHYDRNLNFAAMGSEDEETYSSFSKKAKSARDPQSHRIIEKRRRDRMNNCLADLSRLLPASYMKKGRGRIEKTEIIEMTIKHMKHLQVHACKEMETCEIAVQMEQLHSTTKSDQYRSGFLECIAETMQFVHHQNDNMGQQQQSHFYTTDDFCSRLVAHLHNHCDKITRAEGAETGSTVNGHEEEPTAVPQLPVDQFKSSQDTGEVEPKPKEERMHTMFNYLNGVSSSNGELLQVQHSNNSKRSSPGSGGDSDETSITHSNRATRDSATPSPTHPTTDGSSPTDLDSSHSGGSHHSSSRSGTSSQLRQMLLATNGDPQHRSKSSSSSSNCSSTTTTTHQSQISTDDSANGMYKKFKTNIHQRFTADLEHVFPQSSCHMTPTSITNSSQSESQQSAPQSAHLQQLQQQHIQQERSFEQLHNMKKRKMEREEANSRHNNNSGYNWNQHNGDGPPPPLTPPPSRTTVQQRHSDETESEYSETSEQQVALPGTLENVPIFALHPKGAFYVPMSVELSLIRALFNPPTEGAPTPLLHPVTISVNFCHPLRVLTALDMQQSSVIQPPPSRIHRQELILPGLVPAAPVQRHHYEMEQLGAFSPEDQGNRIRSRDLVRMARHAHEEYKMFRTPQREETVANYQNGDQQSAARREYAVIRSSREHSNRSPAMMTPSTVSHSSRWSHLMAKRAHAT